MKNDTSLIRQFPRCIQRVHLNHVIGFSYGFLPILFFTVMFLSFYTVTFFARDEKPRLLYWFSRPDILKILPCQCHVLYFRWFSWSAVGCNNVRHTISACEESNCTGDRYADRFQTGFCFSSMKSILRNSTGVWVNRHRGRHRGE